MIYLCSLILTKEIQFKHVTCDKMYSFLITGLVSLVSYRRSVEGRVSQSNAQYAFSSYHPENVHNVSESAQR